MIQTDTIESVAARFESWRAAQQGNHPAPVPSGVAEISYEQALRHALRSRGLTAHAEQRPTGGEEASEAAEEARGEDGGGARRRRRRSPAPQAGEETAPFSAAPAGRGGSDPARGAARPAGKDFRPPHLEAEAVSAAGAETGTFAEVMGRQAALAGRRQASLSLRLSAQDAALVRERAAQAGLTVSGYLRHCALEVEALRAQVKALLAEPRPEPPRMPGTLPAGRTGADGWWRRLAGALFPVGAS
jgi:hypothetical protein